MAKKVPSKVKGAPPKKAATAKPVKAQKAKPAPAKATRAETAKAAPVKAAKPAKNPICEHAIRSRQAANADDFHTLTTLDLSGARLPSLEGLAGHPTLEVLYLPKALTSLAGLADLPLLREIDAVLGKLVDISALGNNLPAIAELNFQDTKITDLSPLAACTRLKKLNVGDRVTDLSPLAKLTELEDLVIRGKLRDLSPLAGLQKLTDLNLADCGITDVSALAPLVNLQNLWLFNNGKLTDISPLASMKKLEFVVLPPSVTDTSPLSFVGQLVQN